MTKFQQQSFSVVPTDAKAAEKYRENWDRIFQKGNASQKWKVACVQCNQKDIPASGDLPVKCPLCGTPNIEVRTT